LKHFSVSLLLLISFATFSQKLAFDIFLFGNKIGQTVVEKTIKNDSIINYTLNSASEAKIFFVTRKIELHYDIYYKRNQLVSSFSKSIRNDDLHVTNIRWQGNKYAIDREDGSFNVNSIVNCTTVRLFFEEPCDSRRIFSERMGEFRDIKKTGAGVYEAEMQDGLTYYYRYKNGKLIELEMRKGLLGSAYLRPH
jgi:hypothetical protein